MIVNLKIISNDRFTYIKQLKNPEVIDERQDINYMFLMVNNGKTLLLH